MSTIEIVRREQKTETRIRTMDAHEIVDEIHAREDEIDQLVDRIAAGRAHLEALAVAAKPFLGVSPLAFRCPAGMDITLYEQRCATALVEALASPGVKDVLDAKPDETKPHPYSPDYQAMGDCVTCGRLQRDPIHAPDTTDGS